jgi:hypothetical protein
VQTWFQAQRLLELAGFPASSLMPELCDTNWLAGRTVLATGCGAGF